MYEHAHKMRKHDTKGHQNMKQLEPQLKYHIGTVCLSRESVNKIVEMMGTNTTKA